MRVFRVEHRDTRWGPYKGARPMFRARPDADLLREVTHNLCDRHDCSPDTHPCWWQDDGPRAGPSADPGDPVVFGFESLGQARSWFGRDMDVFPEEHPFVLAEYEVSPAYLAVARCQVKFNRAEAEHLADHPVSLLEVA